MDENLIDLEILTVKDQAYRIKDGALTKRVEQLEQNAGAGGSGGGGTQGAQGPQGEKGDKGDKGDPGNDGADGKSAYQIWLDAGNQGTETDFLNAIKGAKGDKGDKGDPGNDGTNGTNGADGKSAYQIWLDAGNQGTETDFLNAIKGAKGDKGDKGDSGAPGTDGANGADGKSAYEIWLDAGNQGTETDFLNALKGANGDKGDSGAPGTNGNDGADGKSSYQIWLDAGNQGTQSDFLNSLKGAKGDKGDKGDPGNDGAPGTDGTNGTDGANGADGKSAYQIWLDAGNQGTQSDFLNALKGAKGDTFTWDDLTTEQRNSLLTELRSMLSGNFVKQIPDLDAYNDAPDGEIVQFVGPTDTKYTRGFFYEFKRGNGEQLSIKRGKAVLEHVYYPNPTTSEVQEKWNTYIDTTALLFYQIEDLSLRYGYQTSGSQLQASWMPDAKVGDLVLVGKSGVVSIFLPITAVSSSSVSFLYNGQTETVSFVRYNVHKVFVNEDGRRVAYGSLITQDIGTDLEGNYVATTELDLTDHVARSAWVSVRGLTQDVTITVGSTTSSWRLIHVSPSIQ